MVRQSSYAIGPREDKLDQNRSQVMKLRHHAGGYCRSHAYRRGGLCQEYQDSKARSRSATYYEGEAHLLDLLSHTVEWLRQCCLTLSELQLAGDSVICIAPQGEKEDKLTGGGKENTTSSQSRWASMSHHSVVAVPTTKLTCLYTPLIIPNSLILWDYCSGLTEDGAFKSAHLLHMTSLLNRLIKSKLDESCTSGMHRCLALSALVLLSLRWLQKGLQWGCDLWIVWRMHKRGGSLDRESQISALRQTDHQGTLHELCKWFGIYISYISNA